MLCCMTLLEGLSRANGYMRPFESTRPNIVATHTVLVPVVCNSWSLPRLSRPLLRQKGRVSSCGIWRRSFPIFLPLLRLDYDRGCFGGVPRIAAKSLGKTSCVFRVRCTVKGCYCGGVIKPVSFDGMGPQCPPPNTFSHVMCTLLCWLPGLM